MDAQSKVIGCLTSELHESDVIQAGKAAVSAARCDVTERGIVNPMRVSVGDTFDSAASAGEIAKPLVASLK